MGKKVVLTRVSGAKRPAEARAGKGSVSRKLRFSLLAIYIVPLLVLTYIFVQYIYPMFTAKGDETSALGLTAMLTFAVVLSVLGMALISRTADESVDTLKSLNRSMDNILTITKRFEEAGHVDTLVDSVARSAKEILKAEASSLLLYDDSGDLRFEYVEGPAAGFLKGKVLKSGEGITGWAAKEGRPMIINDVQSNPRFASSFDEESGFLTRSMLCVPLSFSGRDLGILEVVNRLDGQAFTEQDLQVLTTLAEHASASIYRNKTYDEMKSDFVNVLDILVTAMDNHLPEKKGHARRVAMYSVKIAKGLGLDEDGVRKVYFGALLHDLGVVRYEPREYQDKEKFKLHPAAGSEMVKRISQWKDIAVIIRDHHERYDGTGYPSGLSGEAISLGGRIVGLAEAFEVMTSRHSYKPAKPYKEAVEEIRSLAGYQFDPRVVQTFLNNLQAEDLAEAA